MKKNNFTIGDTPNFMPNIINDCNVKNNFQRLVLPHIITQLIYLKRHTFIVPYMEYVINSYHDNFRDKIIF